MEPEITAHCMATLAATTIALINKDAGLQTGATTWADNAKGHFDAYANLLSETKEIPREFKRPFTPSWFPDWLPVQIPMQNPTTLGELRREHAEARAEYEEYLMELQLKRRQFNFLHKQLVSSD